MKLFRLVLATIWLQVTVAETDLEVKVLGELDILENVVLPPIDEDVSVLNLRLQQITLNSTELLTDFNNLLWSHSVDVSESIQFLSETYSDNSLSTQECETNISDVIDEIHEKGTQELKNTVQAGFESGQNTIDNFMQIMEVVKNSVTAIRQVVEDCIKLEDDEECLLSTLKEIEAKQNILPAVITTGFTEHQTQLRYLEDDIATGMLQITNDGLNEYVDVLDGFLVCII